MIGPSDLSCGPWIAGGCARRLWFGQPWIDNDVDVFFRSQSDFARSRDRLVAIPRTEASSSPYITDAVFSIETANASTHTVRIGKAWPYNANVQLIKTAWHPSVTDLFDYFDFTVCRFATDGITIVADRQAIDDCESMVLRRGENTKQRLSCRRVVKYSIYGFNPAPEVMSELLCQYHNQKLTETGDDDY